jgi:hypothetical protein
VEIVQENRNYCTCRNFWEREIETVQAKQFYPTCRNSWACSFEHWPQPLCSESTERYRSARRQRYMETNREQERERGGGRRGLLQRYGDAEESREKRETV